MNAESSSALPDRTAIVIGLVALCALMLLLTTWTGDDVPPMHVEAVGELARSLPWTLAWLIAAFGFGRLVWVWRMPGAEHAAVLQLGFGVGIMLWLDAMFGRLGVLQLGGAIGAWFLLIFGSGLAIEQAWRWRQRENASKRAVATTRSVDSTIHRSRFLPHWMVWTATPAMAVLLIAALSAPGWLWRTEFGGYDVMSYHLQLPAEWLTTGRISPLEHNVYSFLPNFTEAAYTHLAVLIGDTVRASAACQLLHASFAVITAALIYRFAGQIGGRMAGAIAAVIFLGTPWIVVTGSMAYNEMGVTMMLALGLCMLLETSNGPNVQRSKFLNGPWRVGGAIGFATAIACGAKLSAFGFVAIPLVVVMLSQLSVRAWLPALSAAAIVGAIVLAPWYVDNAQASGNPVFPFATSIFGSAHWDEQQVEQWNAGHFGPPSVGERLVEGVRQFGWFGIGPDPYEGAEPWLPQWSILPWLLMPAVVIVLMRESTGVWGWRVLAVIVLQVLYWLVMTHVKSRFMVPVAVPSAILLGMSVAWISAMATNASANRLTNLAIAVGLIVWCLVPLTIFRDEAAGAPAARIGFAHALSGEAMRPAERQITGANTLPSVYVNYLLPKDSRVLFIGEAAPLYFRSDYAYTTTWDRGSLSALMLEHEGDPEAWWQRLREDEFTHVLVNPVMLNVWERAGWNDPLMQSDHIIPALEAHATLINEWPSGERLYQLR